jgi:probable F420-dependent oxidoreductase
MTNDKVTFGVGWGTDMHPIQHVELSILADSLGFNGVWPGDTPTSRSAGHDPHILLSYIAGHTKHIKLGTAVYVLPLSHPVRLAKQLVTLDMLSNGRTILGVGPGGEFAKQFEAFGIPVNERGPRTDEYIQLMRKLWTDPTVYFHGRFFNLDGITMEPKPVQKPIPIWIGGRPGGKELGPDGKPRRKSRTAAIRRAALYGDGWIPYYMSIESYRESVQEIREIAKSSGRDPAAIKMSLNNFFFIGDSYEEALKRAYGPRGAPPIPLERVVDYDFIGTAKELIPRIEKFIEAGCRDFVCKLESPNEQIAKHMKYLAKEVIPHFT